MTPKLLKAGDVCEATGLQPYVLRSWEKEFPGIGVQKSADAPRLYRPSDVEQVLRIKQLVFGEGLTLAGARRRLEEAAPPQELRQAEFAEMLDVLGAEARERIARVRSGLQSILAVLSQSPGATAFVDVAVPPARPRGSARGRAETPRAAKKRLLAARKARPAKSKRRRAGA